MAISQTRFEWAAGGLSLSSSKAFSVTVMLLCIPRHLLGCFLYPSKDFSIAGINSTPKKIVIPNYPPCIKRVFHLPNHSSKKSSSSCKSLSHIRLFLQVKTYSKDSPSNTLDPHLFNPPPHCAWTKRFWSSVERSTLGRSCEIFEKNS